MKLSDKHKKLLGAILNAIVLVALGYFGAFLSIFPAIDAHRWIMQMKMGTWADMAGHYQAKVFFDGGHYCLLELCPVAQLDAAHFTSKFTGRHEGPFEIWTQPSYSDINSNHRLWIWLNKDDSNQRFVESFNQAMKLLWDEKQTNATADSESKTRQN